MNEMGYTFLRSSSGEDQHPGYIDVDGANGAIWKPRSRQLDRRKTLNLHRRPISLPQNPRVQTLKISYKAM